MLCIAREVKDMRVASSLLSLHGNRSSTERVVIPESGNPRQQVNTHFVNGSHKLWKPVFR